MRTAPRNQNEAIWQKEFVEKTEYHNCLCILFITSYAALTSTSKRQREVVFCPRDGTFFGLPDLISYSINHKTIVPIDV
ncbi:hypothetical protein H5410_062459 [Solanum commersonii]|uniref:Uncharacterized protein n=1 Tax=Solanum commersonii TaxID=4109 RepID=A0A9J5WAX9_SOLCO|nr:hypothetical protein H5410_062459 [Solanum commersonii]